MMAEMWYSWNMLWIETQEIYTIKNTVCEDGSIEVITFPLFLVSLHVFAVITGHHQACTSHRILFFFIIIICRPFRFMNQNLALTCRASGIANGACVPRVLVYRPMDWHVNVLWISSDPTREREVGKNVISYRNPKLKCQIPVKWGRKRKWGEM
jgi:hypothetical protein